MSENAITSYSEFNSENIKRDNYTNTLIAEALRLGIIDESAVDRIRVDLISALAEIIGYYTKNESTSVKADTANELSQSLMYNIDTYLLMQGDDKKALNILLDRRMSELYGKGYLVNMKLFETAKKFYGKARLTRLKNGSDEYNKTIDKYFRYYLTHYSPKFSAHDKIYLSLREYGLSGTFHIDEAVEVLIRICEINRGREADVVITDTHSEVE